MSQDVPDRILQDLIKSHGNIPLPVLTYCSLVYSNKSLSVEEIYYRSSGHLIDISTVVDDSLRVHRDFLYGYELEVGRKFPDISFGFRLLKLADHLGKSPCLFGLPTSSMKPLCIK